MGSHCFIQVSFYINTFKVKWYQVRYIHTYMQNLMPNYFNDIWFYRCKYTTWKWKYVYKHLLPISYNCSSWLLQFFYEHPSLSVSGSGWPKQTCILSYRVADTLEDSFSIRWLMRLHHLQVSCLTASVAAKWRRTFRPGRVNWLEDSSRTIRVIVQEQTFLGKF